MSHDPFDNPSGTREEILAATYRSLQSHGYADLTIETIGTEFDKSQSLIYHHYDGKDELVLECLEFMLDQYEETGSDCIDDPRTRLEGVLERFLEVEIDPDRQRTAATLFELRAQATRDDEYRDHFTRSDRVFEAGIAAIVREGIDQDVFCDCDPDAVATTLLTTLTGAIVRRSTTDDDGDAWLADVRAELEAYLEARVYQ